MTVLMTTPLIQVRSLKKTYRLGKVDVPVLRGISLDVREGEFLAILGASGSGKSTLLHLLGGLDRPDRSEHQLTFAGTDLTRMSPSARDAFRNTSVGFVFQFYHLLPELTVLENVLVAAMIAHGRITYTRRAGELREYAAQLLTTVGLAHRLSHRPSELSGGERQRVAIARALMNKPRVLLADEPTGNLDRETGKTILDLFTALHNAGQTMVVVTHDAATAARADRIIRLRDGVVVKQDPEADAPSLGVASVS